MSARPVRRVLPGALLAISLAGLLAALPAALAGCVSLPADVPPPVGGPPAEVQPAQIAAPDTASPPPGPADATPTEPPREFRAIRHASGVFSLAVPVDWEALDRSSEQRLLVHYIPPIGYGSRVTVDVTNEGPLAPDQVRGLAESYVHLHYVGQPGYTELNRSELPDGRLQFVFVYDDGQGARGREALTIRQAGPYFTALRVFVSEADMATLSQALDAVAASLTIDPLVMWGSSVASISPADLLVANTAVWRGEDGVLRVTGEVTNAAQVDVARLEARVALCDEGGAVIGEIAGPAALARIPPGASAPFALRAEGLPPGLTVCAQQAAASPAYPDPTYTSALALEPAAGFDDEGRVVIRGSVGNPGLSPVTDIELVFTIYDPAGLVVGLESLALGSGVMLAPGESAAFDHTFAELGGIAQRFVTRAQARVVQTHNPSLAPGADGG